MTTIDACRGCGSSQLKQFLDLGDMPLSDGLVPAERLGGPEEKFPLAVALCPDCALVQITEDVAPEVLFDDEYPYFSSFSDHLLDHSRKHALGLIESQNLGPDSLVVELASNDGYLLKNFVEAGVPVLGIDPAPEQVVAAQEIGVNSMQAFFGLELAQKLVAEGKKADVIIANNVMAHIPDPNSFVAGMAHLLADDGLITVENPSVWDLVDRCAFDTIYHEHFFYHSCLSVDGLVSRHGLHLNHVEFFPDLHGGTNRWHIGHNSNRSDVLVKRMEDERAAGLDSYEFYSDFGRRVDQLRTDLHAMLVDLKAQGKTVAGYGAAAKGAIMLNAAGIDTDLMPYVVDRNVHKQGRHMPGTHQPIRDPKVILEEQPDVMVILAWNFAPEIMSQQAEYRAAGGQFLVPVPTPTILS